MSLASRPQDLCGLGMAFVILACGAVAAQEPAEPPINREQIDAALQLTRAAAKEYEFLAAGADAALELKDEPVLRWSNPTTGEVHGNVFLWTRGGRPMVVGSLFKWFSPHSHMSHEFQSLAEKPIAAKFHGMEVWKTTEPGLKFVELADAPLPARSPASRLLQLKQIARGFAATKIDRDGDKVELRLLTQPVYRYALPGDGVFDGALLAFVQGTDPEVLLLLEVRGAGGAVAFRGYADE